MRLCLILLGAALMLLRCDGAALSLKQLMLEEMQHRLSGAIGPAVTTAAAPTTKPSPAKASGSKALTAAIDVPDAADTDGPELASAYGGFNGLGVYAGGAAAAVGLAVGVGAIGLAAVAALIGLITRFRKRSANSLEHCKASGGTQ